MTDPNHTRDTLDDALRAHVAEQLDPGEIVVTWIAVAATRSVDGGGHVIFTPHQDCMPNWEARGVLATALSIVDDFEGLSES